MAEKNDYRQIFKATSLFGGVQVFNIILGFVRNKAVAVLLGKEGMGILNLFSMPVSMITSIANLGLSFSAVRNISQATEAGNHEDFSKTIITFRRWMWFSGILGTVVTLVLSPVLSQWTFKSGDYTVSFMWIALTLILISQTSARDTVLHGMRKLKLMAQANVLGSILGLCTSLPLYYFYGVKGIVPAMMITAVSGLMLAWYFTRNIKIQPMKLSFKDSFFMGKDMVQLGILTTVSASAWYGMNWLIGLVIMNYGGEGDVGLYAAAQNLTNQTVNLVFMAMVVDFYPRLASINKDDVKVREIVNQQVEISTLLITPLILALVALLPLAIRIVYTVEFLPIIGFIKWYFMGILFKVSYWSLGYIIMAKGDSRTYLFTELTSCLLFGCLAVPGYYFFGLEGLGGSYLVSHFISLIYYYVVVRRKYNFKFRRSFFLMLTFQVCLSVLVFLSVQFGGYPMATYVGLGIFGVAGYYSFRQLSKRLDIWELIASKLNRTK